jgi:hypothetical protein
LVRPVPSSAGVDFRAVMGAVLTLLTLTLAVVLYGSQTGALGLTRRRERAASA